MPIVLTGPKASEEYFRSIDEFVRDTLGEEGQKHYEIVIDDPAEVARTQAVVARRYHWT